MKLSWETLHLSNFSEHKSIWGTYFLTSSLKPIKTSKYDFENNKDTHSLYFLISHLSFFMLLFFSRALISYILIFSSYHSSILFVPFFIKRFPFPYFSIFPRLYLHISLPFSSLSFKFLSLLSFIPLSLIPSPLSTITGRDMTKLSENSSRPSSSCSTSWRRRNYWRNTFAALSRPMSRGRPTNSPSSWLSWRWLMCLPSCPSPVLERYQRKRWLTDS